MIEIHDIDLTDYYGEFPEKNQVIPGWAYSEAVVDYFHGNQQSRGICLPWSKTHGKILLRPGEVSVWAGYNGSGKSLLVGQVMLSAMSQGDSVCIASMEMKPKVTMARMCRQASGTNIPSERFIREFHEWTTNKLWLYDQQSTVKFPKMLALARYCATGVLDSGKKVPIKHLIVDSLMKCGIKVDDYNIQKDFVDNLCAIAKDTQMHVHLVAHMRKSDSEFQQGDKMDIKGASEITDQVDNVFVLWRNKAKEDESVKANPNEKIVQMSDAILSCRKQRHGEAEPKVALWFHKESMQFVGMQNGRPIDFIKPESEAA